MRLIASNTLMGATWSSDDQAFGQDRPCLVNIHASIYGCMVLVSFHGMANFSTSIAASVGYILHDTICCPAQ